MLQIASKVQYVTNDFESSISYKWLQMFLLQQKVTYSRSYLVVTCDINMLQMASKVPIATRSNTYFSSYLVVTCVTLATSICYKWLQMGSKWAAPNGLQMGSKWAPNGLQMDSKWSQKWAQKWARNGLENGLEMFQWQQKFLWNHKFQWQQCSNGNNVPMATKGPMAT